jgi:hypothetical protein
VFCGVGRGAPTARVTLVPLSAIGTTLITVTAATVFGWFVSWISSVVILDLCNSVSLKAQPSYQRTYICYSFSAGVV